MTPDPINSEPADWVLYRFVGVLGSVFRVVRQVLVYHDDIGYEIAKYFWQIWEESQRLYSLLFLSWVSIQKAQIKISEYKEN